MGETQITCFWDLFKNTEKMRVVGVRRGIDIFVFPEGPRADGLGRTRRLMIELFHCFTLDEVQGFRWPARPCDPPPDRPTSTPTYFFGLDFFVSYPTSFALKAPSLKRLTDKGCLTNPIQRTIFDPQRKSRSRVMVCLVPDVVFVLTPFYQECFSRKQIPS